MALELGLRNPHGNNRGQTRQNVILLDLVFAEFEFASVLLDLCTQSLHERLVKPLQVGATLGGLNDVHKALLHGVIARAPLHHHIDRRGASHVPRLEFAGVVENRHRLLEVTLAREMPRSHHRLVWGEELEKVTQPAGSRERCP